MASAGEDAEKKGPLAHCWWRCEMCSHYGKPYGSSSKKRAAKLVLVCEAAATSSEGQSGAPGGVQVQVLSLPHSLSLQDLIRLSCKAEITASPPQVPVTTPRDAA